MVHTHSEFWIMWKWVFQCYVPPKFKQPKGSEAVCRIWPMGLMCVNDLSLFPRCTVAIVCFVKWHCQRYQDAIVCKLNSLQNTTNFTPYFIEVPWITALILDLIQSQKTTQKCYQNNFNGWLFFLTQKYTQSVQARFLVPLKHLHSELTHGIRVQLESDQTWGNFLLFWRLGAACPSDCHCSESSAESHQRWSSRPAKVSRTQMHSRTQHTQNTEHTHKHRCGAGLPVCSCVWAGVGGAYTLGSGTWRRATSLPLRMRVAVRQGEPRDEPLFVYNAAAKQANSDFNMVLKC